MGKHKGRRKREQEGQRELPLAVHTLCAQRKVRRNMLRLSVNFLARHWSSPPATCLHLSPGITRNFSFSLAVWELNPASLGSTYKRGEISYLLLFQPPSTCAILGCRAKPEDKSLPNSSHSRFTSACRDSLMRCSGTQPASTAWRSQCHNVHPAAPSCRAQAFPRGIQLRGEPCPSPPAPLSHCRLAELLLSDPPSSTVLH